MSQRTRASDEAIIPLKQVFKLCPPCVALLKMLITAGIGSSEQWAYSRLDNDAPASSQGEAPALGCTLLFSTAARLQDKHPVSSRAVQPVFPAQLCGCRYDSARSFRPPGRLMFLRPIKSAAQCPQSQRKYDVVWLQQEVC